MWQTKERHRREKCWSFFSKMDWFLYNRDLRHERVKTLFIHIHRESALTCFKVIVFSVCFFFTNIHDSLNGRWRGRHISSYPFCHSFLSFLLSSQHLDISWVIAAESSPLRIAGSQNWTWNLWYTLFKIHSFYTCTGSCCWENA